MKCLSLVVRESTKGELVERLRSIPAVSTYTIFSGEGHSTQGVQPFESAHDEVVGYVPRIRIDLVVEAEAVRSVIDSIRELTTPAGKLGTYWISAVDEIGEL